MDMLISNRGGCRGLRKRFKKRQVGVVTGLRLLAQMVQMRKGRAGCGIVRGRNGFLTFSRGTVLEVEGLLIDIGMARMVMLIRRVKLDIEGPSTGRKISGGQKC